MPRRRVIPILLLSSCWSFRRPMTMCRRDERGAALVEYALVLGLVVITCIAVLVVIGSWVAQNLGNAGQGFHP